jgi:glycosyltransferase involved in cell wall biosynthesis
MDISIVIPLYNESASVGPLCEAVADVVASMEETVEVLLVDDGSTDDTFARARDVVSQDDRFRILKLKKNFGQTTALHAGFGHASGDIIVTLDGDLQNDPADIGRFVCKVQEGHDLVAGYRKSRTESFLTRELPSQVANWFIRKVTGTPVIDNGCALRAYRAEVIKRFPLYSEMHRLLPTILTLAGVQIAQIPVKHYPRKYGESKYGLGRVYKVLVDLISLKTVLTASRLPLFGFGIFSILSAGLGGLSLLTGLRHIASVPERTIIVYLGAAMLWGILSISLLMLGVLASLIYDSGNFRVDDLLEVKVIQESDAGEAHDHD